MKLLKEYIGELLLEDSRGNIRKLGFDKEASNFFHELNPKYSYWIAKELLKKNRTAAGFRPQAKPWGIGPTKAIFKNNGGEEVLFTLKLLKSQNLNPNKMSDDDIWEKVRDFDEAQDSEERGEVMMTFPNGFYWVDLAKHRCDYEARKMGHCGEDFSGHLMSLRDKNKNPHITLTLSSEGIVQAKGKRNTAPVKKYHKYVAELIVQENLPLLTTGEEDLTPDHFSHNVLKWIISQVHPEVAKHFEKAIKTPHRRWAKENLIPPLNALRKITLELNDMDEDHPFFQEVDSRRFYELTDTIKNDLTKHGKDLLRNVEKLDRDVDEVKEDADKALAAANDLINFYRKRFPK
jgi:hypothetical protein